MNTDDRRGPMVFRASRSASRVPLSGRPIGMSMATTSIVPSLSATARSSSMAEAKYGAGGGSWLRQMPIHPVLHASTPRTRLSVMSHDDAAGPAAARSAGGVTIRS